jgi:hypothetical protein
LWRQPRQKMIFRGHRDMLLLLPLGPEHTGSPSRLRPSLEQAMSSDTPEPCRRLFLLMYEVIHKTQFWSAFVLIDQKQCRAGPDDCIFLKQDWA